MRTARRICATAAWCIVVLPAVASAQGTLEDYHRAQGANQRFNGMFTGPAAQELMSSWIAPYTLNGQTSTMFGVWVGKKN